MFSNVHLEQGATSKIFQEVQIVKKAYRCHFQVAFSVFN